MCEIEKWWNNIHINIISIPIKSLPVKIVTDLVKHLLCLSYFLDITKIVRNCYYHYHFYHKVEKTFPSVFNIILAHICHRSFSTVNNSPPIFRERFVSLRRGSKQTRNSAHVWAVFIPFLNPKIFHDSFLIFYSSLCSQNGLFLF